MIDLATAKDRYHFSKLALFNIRLLSKLQSSGTDISNIIAQEALDNGMSEVPSLLHQGSFLQFSYTCIVWLWEVAKKGNYEDKLLVEFADVSQKFNLSLPDHSKINGERNLDNWKSVIRLMRNALGHGNVEATDEHFLFLDQNVYGRYKEDNPTTLTLTWEELGKISECIIHSFSPLLWPETANKKINKDT